MFCQTLGLLVHSTLGYITNFVTHSITHYITQLCRSTLSQKHVSYKSQRAGGHTNIMSVTSARLCLSDHVYMQHITRAAYICQIKLAHTNILAETTLPFVFVAKANVWTTAATKNKIRQRWLSLLVC